MVILSMKEFDDKLDIKSKDFNNVNILKLSFGKKKHVIFKLN